MELTSIQKNTVKELWGKYKAEGEAFRNANNITSAAEIDSQRRSMIPIISSLIKDYLGGDLQLEEFKSKIDSTNKKQRLWGFKGIKGMMFFNQLTNLSISKNKREKFDTQLKEAIVAPSKILDAKGKLISLGEFVKDLGFAGDDRRTAPKISSITYFLSYFWQIQKPDDYPVYYSSVVNALADLSIWKPTGKIDVDYEKFCELFLLLQELISSEQKQKVTLWDIEHVFWFHSQLSLPVDISGANKAKTQDAKKAPRAIKNYGLPDSYIPPIVSVIPALAANDPELADACSKAKTSIDNVFEERLAILFQMLGFVVEELGQGQGRVPDGILTNQEYRYAIIYDAKVRQGGYTMGTDERAVREYISVASERLRRQGFRNIYFMIISSRFSGDHDAVIRSLKIDTDVREVLLVEAEALLELLEEKLRNPELSLGPDGFQHLLASSGTITAAEIMELVG